MGSWGGKIRALIVIMNIFGENAFIHLVTDVKNYQIISIIAPAVIIMYALIAQAYPKIKCMELYII
jgi:hypothetical protein